MVKLYLILLAQVMKGGSINTSVKFVVVGIKMSSRFISSNIYAIIAKI